ncbi:1,3-beta-galactosyl-N-acetylhexosamine phosphorylase [Arthrobacter echini]|uniref:1,3-beta-galactosyl-N-acetylhexosamine phosphorylase n=1 Tax=Arthrobacter echini TaxID=1529066 RepID=A0A4S5E6N9_9MICC|nr:1,3-beta-galactosyl-N-acetylhexosamine phosphorylase [Arthrobacter echini]THJ67142.1 1,3-beta-galactosyl-N-acetylhexosamine phosphorylase [Arthrobacter echini]
MSTGRLTLPIQRGLDDQLPALLERLGADAVRNSDGTELPESVQDLATRVYATYFVARGDEDWARSHPQQRTQLYLMSPRVPAPAEGPLRIRILSGYFADQIAPDTTCDISRWWEVLDRTAGRTLAAEEWRVLGDGADTVVEIPRAQPHHVYTVSFLAFQLWDSTQMYNYVTNDWASDPTKVKEQPYDARHDETWQHMRSSLAHWLQDHPEVDVVRFTTFFYHFTLVFGADARERYVDWFGYSASVSVPAMEEFERETGIRLRAEDFIDEGYYNSPFRVPTATFRAWIDFQHRFVTSRVRELTTLTHEAGKEAMMFLGDNWIGTEPYGPHFPDAGLDAVVGSVGSAATCRMISDIPGVRYREGRFLPYLFPDTFRPGGEPAREALDAWLTARRAVVRSPLDRIGYGGYLSLALEYPDFVDRVEAIADEFREIHDRSGGRRPDNAPFTVGIINAWGSLRSWQTHMVAHALPYRQTQSYVGVIESLAGLPFEVRFLSFDDIRASVPSDIGVLINAGAAGTAYSGGELWRDPALQTSVRAFVAQGGGLIGVGEPSAAAGGGAVLQLSDIFGVDRELGWSLSTTRYDQPTEDHFIIDDLEDAFDSGDGAENVVVTSTDTTVLAMHEGTVRAAVHPFGRGRSVYLAGLPYTSSNARLLHRALYWAVNREDELADLGWAEDARMEVAYYGEGEQLLVCNASHDSVHSVVHSPLGSTAVSLAPGESRWFTQDDMRAATGAVTGK